MLQLVITPLACRCRLQYCGLLLQLSFASREIVLLCSTYFQSSLEFRIWLGRVLDLLPEAGDPVFANFNQLTELALIIRARSLMLFPRLDQRFVNRLTPLRVVENSFANGVEDHPLGQLSRHHCLATADSITGSRAAEVFAVRPPDIQEAVTFLALHQVGQQMLTTDPLGRSAEQTLSASKIAVIGLIRVQQFLGSAKDRILNDPQLGKLTQPGFDLFVRPRLLSHLSGERIAVVFEQAPRP